MLTIVCNVHVVHAYTPFSPPASPAILRNALVVDHRHRPGDIADLACCSRSRTVCAPADSQPVGNLCSFSFFLLNPRCVLGRRHSETPPPRAPSFLFSLPTMTKQSSIPSARAHVVHATPQHQHCYPERPANGKHRDDPIPERRDFPSTGTPDTLLPAHQQEEEFERSEQVTAAAHIVPETTESDRIEPEREDCLDKDASR